IEGEVVAVDTDELVRSVVASLASRITETRGQVIVHGPLPVVPAEETQLGQVFQNLLTNSLKFVASDRAPVVEVAAERVGGEWLFSVTDNGIGIDPRHRERIFGMFKRLHGRDEYPGTGIGLALVKKIVERRRGRIGVEDNPAGPGSRFWFSIPARQETET
ncbi:MAG TPA: ATP-binding protein, partial [Nocardioides sp.]|nr:ATP-binding protein [Nocardioides sp.]